MLFHTLGKNRAWLSYVLAGQTPPAMAMETLPEVEQLKQKYDDLDFANFDYLTYVVTMVPEPGPGATPTELNICNSSPSLSRANCGRASPSVLRWAPLT